MRFVRKKILMFIIAFIPFQLFATANKKEKININPEIQDLNSKEKIHIYPNPTSKYIQIQSLDLYHIELLDLEGKKIKQVKSTNRIYVSDVADGLYLINLTDSNGNNSQQIVAIINNKNKAELIP